MEATLAGTQDHISTCTHTHTVLSKPQNLPPHTHTHNLLLSGNLWNDYVSWGAG